jgi:hypothetical protein
VGAFHEGCFAFGVVLYDMHKNAVYVLRKVSRFAKRADEF